MKKHLLIPGCLLLSSSVLATDQQRRVPSDDGKLHAPGEMPSEHRLPEAPLPGAPSDVVTSLNYLAALYMRQGSYPQAEPLLQHVLEMQEAAPGKEQPHIAQQRLDEALNLLERAFTISESHLRQEVFGYSEAHLAHVLSLLREAEERLYSLVRAHPDNARLRRLALCAALLRKGRSVQELATTSRIILRSLDPEDRERFEQLRALRTQLAALKPTGPGALSPADYQQRLKELTAAGDLLEADLARRSAPLRAHHALPLPSELIDRVAQALPKDGALVEFVAYRDSPLFRAPGSPTSLPPGPLRYLALLLFADGSSHALDLGLAEPLDALALRLHQALSLRSSLYQEPAQQLFQLAFQPLVPYLRQANAHRLFLSPDSQLALTPFAALLDGSQFLIDSWDIIYLTSGTDLLPRPQAIPEELSVAVLADPAFTSASAPARPAQAASTRSPALTLGSSGQKAVPWPRLPSARKEAQAIQQIFPQARLFLDSSASKQNLLALTPPPDILHIATHGFFLEDPPLSSPPSHAGRPGTSAAPASQQPLPDPMLRSGLVLAGPHPPASLPGSFPRDTSLVTALELAGMNLWGTQLVVLSASNSGRGSVKLGEGVYGLRRALVIAGAETLVTSLWAIKDDMTRQLMENYYQNLQAGLGRASALRQAMLQLRERHPHPSSWAPFIVIGQDEPLRSKAPSR